MKNEPTYSLLNAINYPKDLRQLSVDQLPEVCEELRQDIIKELSCNPGHFAASLGVVELTVALHYVYNTPYDRIVWDVGHQAYGHKILTGVKLSLPTVNWAVSVLFPHRKRVNMTHSLAVMPPTPSRQRWVWQWQPREKEKKTAM